MKKKLFQLLVALLLPLVSSAQGGKYGSTPEDSVKCVQCLSLYQEFIKQDNITDAIASWRCAMVTCPDSRKGLYIDGLKIRKYQIDMAKDPAVKAKLIDSLYMVYDQRIEHFGERGYVLGRKAIDMMRYSPERTQEIFDLLKQSVDERKGKSEAGALAAYYQALSNLYGENKATKDQMFQDYVTISGFIDANIADERMKAEEKDYYIKARDAVNELFFRVAGCEDIDRTAKELLARDPQNMDLKRRLLKVLDAKDCTDLAIYQQLAEEVHRANPTHESAYSNGILRVKQQQWSGALEFFREAIDLCGDCPEKTKYLLKAGQVANAAGNASLTRTYAERILQVEPKNGEALMLIGNAIAAAAGDCQGMDSKAVYWLAYDYYQRARNADPSVADKASERMASCAAHFPTQEELFFNQLKEGAAYEVNCGGASGSTTVRARK